MTYIEQIMLKTLTLLGIVNILILITTVSKTSLCPKEQLATVGLQTNFAHYSL